MIRVKGLRLIPFAEGLNRGVKQGDPIQDMLQCHAVELMEVLVVSNLRPIFAEEYVHKQLLAVRQELTIEEPTLPKESQVLELIWQDLLVSTRVHERNGFPSIH